MGDCWRTASRVRWRNGYANSISPRHDATPYEPPRTRPEPATPVANQGQRKGRQPMPTDKRQNLQDTFLNAVRKAKTPLTIFLVNGVKLQGVVSWFDSFCVLLRRDGQAQLVYKHAISTIMPAQPVQLYEPPVDEDEGED